MTAPAPAPAPAPAHAAAAARPAFRLEPFTAADIPELHKLSVAAFAEDQHTLMKVWEKGKDLTDIGDEMPTGAIQSWLDAGDVKGKSIKAVNEEDGKIIGWVSWGFYNLEGKLEREPSDPEPVPLLAPINHPSFPVDPTLPPLDQMSNLTSAHLFTLVERTCTPPNRFIYCRSICVHPYYQGRGVGSALVKAAVDIADEHNAGMWVHLSDQEGKKRAFEKWGFEEVDRLPVDLDKYKKREMPKGKKGGQWGVYTFRTLMRPPLKGTVA